MAKHSYQVGRKEYICAVCGEKIKKGIEYVKVWNFYSTYQVHTDCYSKTPKSRWETSEYKGQLLDMQDAYDKDNDVDDLLSMLEDILYTLEDKYDNMPEQLAEGSLVEERKDAVEEAISNIEDLKYQLDDLAEPQEEDYEDEDGVLNEEDFNEAQMEYEDEKENIYEQIQDELYNIDI